MSHERTDSLFPKITPEYLLTFQFSKWYPKFASVSIKSTIIRPLGQDFREYLDSDSVFVPEGSEDLPAESTLSDDEADSQSDDEASQPESRTFAFPELDAQIRKSIEEYGAVFPKLNFSSPKDASWILPASSPLKCMSPSDVYLLLKSSDFVSHDLDPESVFDGCGTTLSSEHVSGYELELVLRKWYSIDRSRELRCFVRDGILIGISQRDTNFYDYMAEPETSQTIVSSIQRFWESNIKNKWDGSQNYVFDILLTRDLSRGHIVDFNPYAPRTDPLLFTYEELHQNFIKCAHLCGSDPNEDSSDHNKLSQITPEFRVVDSGTHPAATRNAPAHQHNMVPLEAFNLSAGRTVEEFADALREEIAKASLEQD